MLNLNKYIDYISSLNNEYVINLFIIIIFLIVSSVVYIISRNSLRIKNIKQRAHSPSMAGEEAASFDRRMPRNSGMAAVSTAFSKTASRFDPGDKSKSSAAIRLDLIQAGYHDPSALAWYLFSRAILSVSLPAIGFPILIATELVETTLATIGLLFLLALIGMILPTLYLSRRKSKLAEEYRDGFPELMDLLVVCAEAGVGLSAAITRVTREIAITHRHLGVNLHIMTLELRAGQSLSEAFDSLARRVTIEEVRSLGSLLQQSEELGTSLTQALRTYSSEMREKRFYRAEEKAYALPAKMMIPLGLFVFPVMMIVIMLPLVIRLSAAGILG